MRPGELVLLTIDSDIGRTAARRLGAAFPGLKIIVEKRVSRSTLLRRRIKRAGLIHVAGQLGFMLFAVALQRASRRRIAEIMHDEHLEPTWPESCEVLYVASVNAPACVAYLQRLAPKAVLVVGTRIIDRAVLAAVACPFINYHAGITPKYRGTHGGYWAKAEDDLARFGVTVPLVDAGIDTGAVVYQALLKPSERDNYATFPYLQLAAALPLLEQAGRDALAEALAPHRVDLPSRLWSHPTIWGYVAAGLRRGAW
jgi:folate-dependent phosphoribosylglycinamide formyltransferase PurN